MSTARAVLPDNIDPEHAEVDRDTIPDDLLAQLRALHRARPEALDADLPELGLTRLTGGRNNRVYRWSSPRGLACLKLYCTDKTRPRPLRMDRTAAPRRARHHRRGSGVLARPASRAACRELAFRARTADHQAGHGEQSTAGDGHRPAADPAGSLGPFATLGRLDSASDFVRRITSTWPEQLRQHPDEALTRDMTTLLTTWHERGDVTVLAEPSPLVFSHGDGNLDNWLWHDFISAIYVLDWEFAGHSDAAYDAAELIEHPSARTIDDDLWLALLPELGVDDDHGRRRFAAAPACVCRTPAAAASRWPHRSTRWHRPGSGSAW